MIEIQRHPQGGYRLDTMVDLKPPLTEVFAFFADAHNLEELTPPWLRFSVLTPAPIEMSVGTQIDYRLRLHGVPIRWRSRIAAWEPPHRFVDEQVRGPYRRWHHEHTFEPFQGGTRMRDVVHYQTPGGALANWLIVGRDVRRIFEYRESVLLKRFGIVCESTAG